MNKQIDNHYVQFYAEHTWKTQSLNKPWVEKTCHPVWTKLCSLLCPKKEKNIQKEKQMFERLSNSCQINRSVNYTKLF